MFDDGAPPHLISSHSVDRSNSFFSLHQFRYLTANEKRKKKEREREREREKDRIAVHMSTVSLVVRSNSRAHR